MTHQIIYPKQDLPRVLPTKPRRDDWFWRRVDSVERSKSIWQASSGTWYSGAPTPADIADATVYYQGGRTYQLTEAEATTLEAAGFTTTLSG